MNDAPVTVWQWPLATRSDLPILVDIWDRAWDLETPHTDLVIEIIGSEFDQVELLDDGHTIQYWPDVEYDGFDQILFSVTDSGDGASEPLTSEGVIYVLVDRNDPPLALDGEKVLSEDQAITIELNGSDPDGDTIWFDFLEWPQFGSIIDFDPDSGRAVYVPDPHFSGQDSISFVVYDGEFESEPATMTLMVHPVNDSPATESCSEVVLEDETREIDLWNCAWDVESSPEQLAFIIHSTDNGSTELLDDGHTVLFTPNPDFNGLAALHFSVTDTGEGSSEPLTISSRVELDVLPMNDQPQAIPTVTSVPRFGEITIQLRASDIDGDAVAFLLAPDAECECGSINGHVELDTETGMLTYRPHDEFVGTEEITFYADDNTGEYNSLSEEATLTITVTLAEPGIHLSDGVLTLIGSSGNDSISLRRLGTGYTLVTNIPGIGTYTIPNRTLVSRIVVRALNGNDTVNLAALLTNQPSEVYGGIGNDRITGGPAHDILMGDSGNDVLTGGRGDDLLIGGDGRDRLVGSLGNDLLFAGSLDVEALDPCEPLSLGDYLEAWQAASTPDEKIEAVLPLIDFVLDDGSADTLTGGLGADLFITNELDRVIDKAVDDLAATL